VLAGLRGLDDARHEVRVAGAEDQVRAQRHRREVRAVRGEYGFFRLRLRLGVVAVVRVPRELALPVRRHQAEGVPAGVPPVVHEGVSLEDDVLDAVAHEVPAGRQAGLAATLDHRDLVQEPQSLALARRGHPVDVVEMAPKFAGLIRADAERESLNVRVIERDIFSTADDLQRDYRLILLSEVVSDFRTAEQLRAVFELAAQCLAPGGRLVFNAFLAKPGYLPDAGARELGQQCYTTRFTSQELDHAASGLPLQLVADDSVYDYEMTHLPEGAWPPTSWYADWVSGCDVFDLPRDECPIEMRWLVYQKSTW